MPQVAGVRPFNERDLADQLGLTYRHCSIFPAANDFPHREAFFSGRFLNGHWAVWSALRAGKISSRIPCHEAVLHLRDEDEFFHLVNAHEQRIEADGPWDVTANDKFLLQVRAKLDPGAEGSPGSWTESIRFPTTYLPDRACAPPQEPVPKEHAATVIDAADPRAWEASFPASRGGVRSVCAATISRRGSVGRRRKNKPATSAIDRLF